MNRYDLEVIPAGTRMDGAKLFTLKVTDCKAAHSWMKHTKHEDLTEYELRFYMGHFKEEC